LFDNNKKLEKKAQLFAHSWVLQESAKSLGLFWLSLCCLPTRANKAKESFSYLGAVRVALGADRRPTKALTAS